MASLLPVFVAALATQVLFVVEPDLPSWLRVFSLGISGLILVLVGFLLGQTLLCARLNSRSDRTAARLLRGQLKSARRSTPAAAWLLVFLNLVPRLMPDAPNPAPAFPSHRLPRTRAALQARAVAHGPDPAPRDASVEREAAVPEATPAAGRPLSSPVRLDVPESIAVDDAEFPQAPLAGLPGLDRGMVQARSVVDEDDRFPLFRPGLEEPFPPDPGSSLSLTIHRLGLPAKGIDGDWIPPEMKLEVSLLHGSGRASELSLVLDVPIGPDESLRTSITLGRMSDGEGSLSESGEASWDRVTVAYERRLAGHERDAPFDVSISLGVTADRFQRVAAGAPATSLSPYIGVDTALWQQGTAGLLIHAGYSIPLDVTGSSSGIVDVSATVRIDLSQSISIHAGYRYLIQRRGGDGSGTDALRGPEGSDDFSGPVFGLYIRF